MWYYSMVLSHVFYGFVHFFLSDFLDQFYCSILQVADVGFWFRVLPDHDFDLESSLGFLL